MKVLIPVPQLPLSLSDIKGGAHSAVINLLNGFSHFDINVKVISFSKEVNKSFKINFSEKIEIIYEYEGLFTHHAMNYLFFGKLILKKYIKAFNPDIIHFQAGNSFLLSKFPDLLDKKSVLTIHGMASEEAKRKIKLSDRLKWRINDSLNKLLIPNNIIHLSNFSFNRFKNISSRNYDIIPNALEESYFNIPAKNYTDNVLLYIGVIDNNKNIINLIRSIKFLKERDIIYKLEVLGDFNNKFYKDYILKYINQNRLEDDIHFNGWVNSNQVKNYLHQSDILVVSSFHESLPMVIAEAMAAGKIVVASSVGGIPEMINDGLDGYLYNLNSPGELNEILEILYNNHSEILKISKEAKITALKKYMAKNVAERTIQFYNKCLSN